MNALRAVFFALVFIGSVVAEPLVEGRVRLESGEPVVDAQVRLFDLSDLRPGAIARALTDGRGYFALPLGALGGHALPEGFALGPNYPNPFNPSTIIPYQLPQSAPVRLEVFNLLGQRIATLVDGERSVGFHTATWHATDGAGRAVGAGVYIYRMTVGMERQTGRMVLIDGQAGVSAAGAASGWPGASGGSGLEDAGEQEYRLTVSGRGLVPYVDGSFRVAAGMAPVELVVSAGKVTADEPVSIPDAKLRAAIAAALGKVTGATITQGDMKTLIDLEAKDAGISDLTGLEFATNLTNLSLWDNTISDISVLSGLTNLVDLQLGNNTISDISVLSGLTNLTNLSLWDNTISDISVLSGLTNLTRLHLPYNDISDISALSGLTNLIGLRLGNNRISDISALSGLTNLTSLRLNNNDISDISALLGLTKLIWLRLNANDISDISALSGLTNLVDLQLGNNDISDISALLGLTKLSKLGLERNPLSPYSINDHIPALQDRGVKVVFDPTPSLLNIDPTPSLLNIEITDDPTPVTIPDANLRAAIAAALGITPPGDLTTLMGTMTSPTTITRGDMTRLTIVEATDAGISDLTGLEFATNLTELALWDNQIRDLSALSGLTRLIGLSLSENNISDVSALSGLTHLTRLWLESNNITDLSALSGLTKLTHLDLESNNITDLSALSGLTKLRELDLEFNNITDLSALSGLTKLTGLDLEFNNITDLSALSGLTKLTGLWLRGNPLNVSSINNHIPALRNSGAVVLFDPPLRESDFDIELVFLDDHFDKRDKRVIRYAARRWMSIIREDLPDYTVTGGWSGPCGDQSYAIPSGERIDDLRIYVVSFNDDGDDAPGGWASPRVLRETSHLSVVGCMGFNLDDNYVPLSTALHEIGHVLGIGTQPWSNNGFVQESPGDVHFNGPRAIAAFNAAGGRNYTGKKVPLEEGWGHWRESVLSGELMEPTGGEGRVSAITIQALADVGYSVDVTQADPYTLPRAAAKVAALPGDRLMGRLAPQPEWSCGVGTERQPIHVVDEQGRIIRTLHR